MNMYCKFDFFGQFSIYIQVFYVYKTVLRLRKYTQNNVYVNQYILTSNPNIDKSLFII